MTNHQIHLIKSSWALVGAIPAETVGSIFYSRLFEITPGLRQMFQDPMPAQSKKLISMLSYVIGKLDRLEDVVDEVVKLSQRHVGYGVKEGHYAVVGDAFLWTLEKGLGEDWNEELKQAWAECYDILSSAMINAAGYARQHAA